MFLITPGRFYQNKVILMGRTFYTHFIMIIDDIPQQRNWFGITNNCKCLKIKIEAGSEYKTSFTIYTLPRATLLQSWPTHIFGSAGGQVASWRFLPRFTLFHVERLHAVCKMYSWWWVLIFSLWSWSFPTAVFPGIYLTKNTSTSRNSAFYFSCTIVVKINEINIRPWIRDLKAYIFLLGTVHKHLLGGPMRKKGGGLKIRWPQA